MKGTILNFEKGLKVQKRGEEKTYYIFPIYNKSFIYNFSIDRTAHAMASHLHFCIQLHRQ